MDNTSYYCGICNKCYTDVKSRNDCETRCVKKQVEEEKAAAEAKKKAEQEVRKAEVDAAFEYLHRVMTAYVKDYGHYEYSDGGEDTNFHWPSRLWHSFW